jgi:F-type H+-transporting ATPase subunit b
MKQHTSKVDSALAKACLLVCLVLLPTVAFAAGGGGHADSGVILKDFLYRTLSFVLMVGLVAYFVTKPVRKGLSDRSAQIEKTLADAKAAQEAAEAKHLEYSEKLAKATEEIASITVSIRHDGEVEREKILVAAKEMAVKIEQEAESKASSVVAKARVELREEAARLAVELAEDMLRKQVSAEDQKRLVDEYMHKVGELN